MMELEPLTADQLAQAMHDDACGRMKGGWELFWAIRDTQLAQDQAVLDAERKAAAALVMILESIAEGSFDEVWCHLHARAALKSYEEAHGTS